MKHRLTAEQIADLMAAQFQVWKGTPNAKAILEDCCGAFAQKLGFKSPSVERELFMIAGGIYVDSK